MLTQQESSAEYFIRQMNSSWDAQNSGGTRELTKLECRLEYLELSRHTFTTHHSSFHLHCHKGCLKNKISKSAYTESSLILMPLSIGLNATWKLHVLGRQCATSPLNEPHFKHEQFYSPVSTSSLRIPPGLRRSDTTLLCRSWLGVAFTRAYALH